METLSKEEKQELRELYNKLNTLYGERAKLEVLKKERENSLKEEVASVCEIKNKQGETEASKVKMPLIQAILNEIHKEKANPKKIEFELMEYYEQALKKEVNQEVIQSYLSINESLDENKSFIKESYKDSTLLSQEILDALNLLLKEEFKLQLNEELSKAGYEIKEPKDLSTIEFLKDLIKEALK